MSYLLLIFPLGGKTSLDASPRLEERLSLSDLSGIVSEHPCQVHARKQANIAQDLKDVRMATFQGPF